MLYQLGKGVDSIMEKKYSGAVFVRNETSVNFLPVPYVYMLVLSLILIFIFGSLSAICILTHRYNTAMVMLFIMFALCVFGIICHRMDWHHNVEFVFEGDRIWYSYTMDASFDPKSDDEVDILFTDIRKIVQKRGDLVIYGKMEKHIGDRHVKNLHKFRARDIPEYHEDIMEHLDRKLQEHNHAM